MNCVTHSSTGHDQEQQNEGLKLVIKRNEETDNCFGESLINDEARLMR